MKLVFCRRLGGIEFDIAKVPPAAAQIDAERWRVAYLSCRTAALFCLLLAFAYFFLSGATLFLIVPPAAICAILFYCLRRDAAALQPVIPLAFSGPQTWRSLSLQAAMAATHDSLCETYSQAVRDQGRFLTRTEAELLVSAWVARWTEAPPSWWPRPAATAPRLTP
jgi:hypothetical protein